MDSIDQQSTWSHVMSPFLRVALAVLAIATLAACSGAAANPSGVARLGSQSPDPASSTEPESSMDPEEAALAFASCMREHGVDMPDPQVGSNGELRVTINGGPGSLDMEEMQAAQEACQDLMPGPMGEPRELTAEEKDAMLGFAQCMRDHGIDMPDPVFEGNGMVRIGGGPGSAATGQRPVFDPRSDEFQAAYEGDLRIGSAQPLFVTVTAQGRPAQLEPYLGAFGHLVVMREGDLGYVHVHPEEQLVDGKVKFWLAAPGPGRYRMFFDFQVAGTVHTAEWTAEVR